MQRLAELLRGIPLTDQHVTSAFVDYVELHRCEHRHGVSLVLHRAYRHAAEVCDVNADTDWVRWRRVLASCQE